MDFCPHYKTIKATISFNNTVQIIVITPVAGFSEVIAETEEKLLTVISDILSVQTFGFQQNYPNLSCATLGPIAVILECGNRYLCQEKKASSSKAGLIDG